MSTSPRPSFLCSPTGSSTAIQDQFPQASSRRVLPLPSGTLTLLPHVQLCDNVELPTGPWSAPDLELRWHAHTQSHRGLAQPLVTSIAGKTTLDPASSSALDDDDDDDDEEEAIDTVNQRNVGRARLDSRPATLSFDDEFLVPFFLSLPPSNKSSLQPPQPQPSHCPAPPVPMSSSRRSSAGSINGGRASHRPSFSRLTPLSPSESVAATAPMAVSEGDAAKAVPFTVDPSHATLPELPQQQPRQPKVPAPPPIGFLRPEIVKALIEDNRKMVAINCKPVWSFLPPIQFQPPVQSRRPSYSSRSGSRRNSQPGTPNTTTATTGGADNTTSLADRLARLDPTSGGGDSGAVVIVGATDSEANIRQVASGVYGVGFEKWVNTDGEAEGDGHGPDQNSSTGAATSTGRLTSTARDKRREHMDRIVRGWKMQGQFAEVLKGWRDEEYSIYGPTTADESASALPGSNVAFTMERAACALFGLATFGVHCNGYVRVQTGSDGPQRRDEQLKLWIPRRSATKQTWPSYLDNTVAGGITAGDTPYASILRECAEEASLDIQVVEDRIRFGSVVVYNYRTAQGWIQPEVQYVYDLDLTPEFGALLEAEPLEEGEDEERERERDRVRPRTNAADGEVESFELMNLATVVARICDHEFKPNCALVLIDFFLRHGYLTPESDAKFLDVATRLRRSMSLPGPA